MKLEQPGVGPQLFNCMSNTVTTYCDYFNYINRINYITKITLINSNHITVVQLYYSLSVAQYV